MATDRSITIRVPIELAEDITRQIYEWRSEQALKGVTKRVRAVEERERQEQAA